MKEPVVMGAVYKTHRTTVDGGFTVSFDVSEQCADEVNDVFKKKNERLILVIMTEDEYMRSSKKGK